MRQNILHRSSYWGIILLVLALAGTGTAEDEFTALRDRNWPTWRGPRANGVAIHGKPPIRWDEQTNVRWKVTLPGQGSGTPIVWQGRIYLTAAIETNEPAPPAAVVHPDAKTRPPERLYEFVLLCYDLESGRELFRRVACRQAPHEGRHTTNSYASASPCTDGRRIYASFGSRGLYAYDLEGKLLWSRDLGQMRTRYGWGEGASPAVHDGSLIVNWDHEDQSFVEVLDAATGKTRWHADRDEPTSWSTPVVVEHDGRTQVIVSATHRVRSYDLATGDILWQCGGLTVNVIPTPIVSGDTVYCLSGYRSAAALAIGLDSTGDLTGTDRIRWTYRRGTPYVPSGIVVQDQIYFTGSNTGVLTSLAAKTGELVYGPERLGDLPSLYASPVAADGRLYFTARDGTTAVLRAGPKLEVLSVNRLDDAIDASPAIVGRKLLLRGEKQLYCLEADTP